MKPRKNPLRRWFDSDPKPMVQSEFARRVGISQPFLTTLLLERPPWPARATLRRIVKVTKGAVTADAWLALDDPPLRDRKH
jgi:DNA-binding transcriptional regulator YdaS (Cro superfamily)